MYRSFDPSKKTASLVEKPLLITDSTVSGSSSSPSETTKEFRLPTNVELWLIKSRKFEFYFSNNFFFRKNSNFKLLIPEIVESGIEIGG